MRIVITEPTVGGTRTGNLCQAQQWARYLRDAGHEVELTQGALGAPADALIALNATKSSDAVRGFRAANPERAILVVLTGTDLYPDLDDEAIASMRLADRVVILQPRARDRIPAEFRDRTSVIIQSVEVPQGAPPQRRADPFDVAVVSHFRDIKDPLRVALAARLLPASSRIRVRHAGDVLDTAYREQVEREVAENPRYELLGELDGDAAYELIASAQLLAIPSFHEGGARVIGEAIVAGTPILAARNDASHSLLGPDYPGLYDAGDTEQLAALLERCEADPAFLAKLRAWIEPFADRFDPRHEKEALCDLVAGLESCTT